MSMALFLHSIAFIRREKQGVPLIGCLLVCFLINWDILLVTCGSNQGHLYIFIGFFFFFFFIKVVYFQFYNLININNIKKNSWWVQVSSWAIPHTSSGACRDVHWPIAVMDEAARVVDSFQFVTDNLFFCLISSFLDFRTWHFKISKYVFNLLFIRIWFLLFLLLFFLDNL